MPLDFSQLAHQITAFVPRFQAEAARQLVAAAQVRAALLELSERWPSVDDARAGFLEDPATIYAPPPAPNDYRVIATDGSQIAIDRHQIASCYVINIGTVLIRYGANPGAALGSVAELLTERANDGDDSGDDDNGDPDILPPSRQASLELERAAAELKQLRELVEASSPDLFTLALLDNSLVLWSQTMNAEQADDYRIVRRYIRELEAFATLARSRPMALAGYLSQPGSPWVADLVQRAGTLEAKAAVDAPAVTIFDRHLFDALPDGARTARFKRVTPMLKLDSYPSDCWVDFCYLRAGGEIARVEVPRWVSRDSDLLGLTHAAILDQCRRNQGNPAYPVALMEAHEQAVVSDADRRAFWELITQQLEAAGVLDAVSAKSRTKRTPWT